MSNYLNRSPAETLARQLQKADVFNDRVQRAITRHRLPPNRERRARAITGAGRVMSDLRLSDVAARKEAAVILFDVVKAHYGEIECPELRMYHLTFVDDIGVASDRTPHLKIDALKRKVDKAIRAMGLSGLVFIEVQPLLNYPARGQGRTLLLHAHALCWGVVSTRAFRKAKKTLNASRSWQCMFGAKPVVSRRLRGGLDDALKIAAYVAKLPHDGKYCVPHEGGGFRFKSTLQDYPDRLALRIAEGLSHLSIYEAVFAVKQGRMLRLKWKRELAAWHRQRCVTGPKTLRFAIGPFWDRVRLSGSSYYAAPFTIN
ncbi:MAG: hypothetical protein EON56_01585 [Alphaproteobacteria bacterium]|nr:MAG: hypothetical protein EON56_01585 [Alphaproteobacteria bacterium]